VYASRPCYGKAALLVQRKGCFADCAVNTGWHTDQIAWKSDCVISFMPSKRLTVSRDATHQ